MINANNPLCRQAQNSHALRLYCFVAFCLYSLLSTSNPIAAQTVIGGLTPDPSAMLDVQSQSKGVLFPRMTTAERNLITNAPTGLMIFNTSENRLQINLGTPGNASWQNINPIGTITGLDCAGATLTGNLYSGQAASGVSVSVPYTGGNGGVYQGQNVTSTGVTGLTATLTSGTLNTGSGTLTYSITGTPSGSGTASFALNLGGRNCTLALNTQLLGSITGLTCASATLTGNLYSGQAASGVSVSVPYTGGNGQLHAGQTVTSTGVTGLTATLSSGSFASGSGNLSYAITGTPNADGLAAFALNIGGQSCTLNVPVGCGAFVAAGQWKVFSCYNLGAANTSADPFTPSWEINGNYYQWGTNPTCFGLDGIDGTNTCSFPVYGAAGPWGNSSSEDNRGAISNWNNTSAIIGSWVDASTTATPVAKGPQDPCPAGFRVPSKTQWEGVINNNSITNVGGSSWSASATNYSTGKNFGSVLFLPAAGGRSLSTGTLFNRGSSGYYWSSTENGTGDAWNLNFSSGGALMISLNRTHGLSVRCVAE